MEPIGKWLLPIKRQLALIIGRAVIRAVFDKGGSQSLQLSLLKNELRDEVPRFQEYGFSSLPHPGCEAIALFSGGNRDQGVVIATDDPRHRPARLKHGEVALYSDEGDLILLERGNRLTIKTKSLAINAEHFAIQGKSSELVSALLALCDALALAHIGQNLVTVPGLPAIRESLAEFTEGRK